MSETSTQRADKAARKLAGQALAGWRKFAEFWRAKRWFRYLTYLGAIGLLGALAFYITLTRDLPDAENLLDYQPALPSVVRGADGEIVHRYERERRIELQFKDLPTQLINAYTSAEDKTFWSHSGIDATRLCQCGV